MNEAPVVGDQATGQAAAATQRRSRHLQLLAQRLYRLPSAVSLESVWVWCELFVIALWGLFVTRVYLDLNPYVVPTGREYLSVIQSHHFWTSVARCGACAMWNGSHQGGAPAFVELHGSPLHPIVAVTTLLFGVLNGSKVSLVVAFILAGIAQWWLAWVLGLGRAARLWGGCMAIVAGHLAARMANGLFGIVLSTAAASLVLPPLLLMGTRPTRRNSIALGVLLALALLAGQAYQQIGLVCLIAILVPIQLFYSDDPKLLLRRYALAAGLAALLSSAFLVPLLHFLPQFVKDTDPEFKSAQPLRFMLLNLLINDSAFYTTEVLDKLPYADLYSFFVGWVPLLLATFGVYHGLVRERNQAVLPMALGALAILWLGSGAPFAWMASQPWLSGVSDRFASVRYSSLIAGLSVPLLLGLAALAVDRMLRVSWPQVRLNVLSQQQGGRSLNLAVGTKWLLLVPLLMALNDARAYGAQWLTTYEQDPAVNELLRALRTTDLQWVNPPFGEHYFIEPAVGMGLKLSYGIRQWGWRDHQRPEAMLEASHGDAPPGMMPYTTAANIRVYSAPPGREYAALAHADGTRTVCSAQGIGGEIDVTCDAARPGRLEIKENGWSGWGARVNGVAAALLPGQWLAVEVPAGQTTVQFRYRPWDVPLGILLTLCGLALTIVLWFREPRATPGQPIGEEGPSMAI